eukprot:3584918-Prymnesium_polylepis.1
MPAFALSAHLRHRVILTFALCLLAAAFYVVEWWHKQGEGLHQGLDDLVRAAYRALDPLKAWMTEGEGSCPDGLIVNGPALTRGNALAVTVLLGY